MHGTLRNLVAVMLTFAAGYVDAVGWLVLNRVFTAQMSGNTVLVAVHGAAGDRAAMARQAFTIGMFFVGLLLSGGMIELAIGSGLKRTLAAAMLAETVLLAAFAVSIDRFFPTSSSGVGTYVLIAFAATAMGIQDTSLRMAGILDVYTTHVTGTLTKLGEDLVSFGAALLRRGKRQHQEVAAGPRKIGRSLGLFLAFLAGAWAAAEAVASWGHARAMIVPIVLVIVGGAIDLVLPLAQPRARER